MAKTTDQKAQLFDLLQGLSNDRQALNNIITLILSGDTTIEDVRRLVAEVRDHLGTVLDMTPETSQFYNPLNREILNEEVYMLPSILTEDHNRFMGHIAGRKSVKGLPFTGLLLKGSPGMGKSEYAYYLAYVAREHCIVVQANIPLIVKSVNPPLALRQLYRELETLAQDTGRVVIVLFDEFESLVRQFVKSETKATTVTESQSSGSSRHTHDERESFEIDKEGEALMSEFKTLLSGTSERSAVFTIATTNHNTFPEALTREGRLKALTFHPIVISKKASWESQFSVEALSVYGDVLPIIFQLLQTAYIRDSGQASSAISACQEVWAGYAASAIEEICRTCPTDTLSRLQPDIQLRINTIWAAAILKFAGATHPLPDKFWVKEIGRPLRIPQGTWTNAAIAALVVKNREAFTTPETVKEFIINTFITFAPEVLARVMKMETQTQ